MKMPSFVNRFLPQKKPMKEIFSSMVLTPEFTAAALWEMGDRGVPNVLATNDRPCAEDSWEARLDAVDEALASVEDAVGTTTYKKTVLGLPSFYLSQDGDIKKEVLVEIKKLTKELELTPIGFVSITQALLYRLKKEEGVPPSAIFLSVTKDELTVSLYKVGKLSGERSAPRSRDTAIVLEEILKEFKDVEVMPARILLYGKDVADLDAVKTEILRYPWTTKLNFLHFPKIEIVSADTLVRAVSLAGASELSRTVGEIELPEESEPQTAEEQVEEAKEVEAKEVEEAEEIEEEESNVVAVDPSHLGFKKNVDVLEEIEKPKKFTMPSFPRVDISSIREKILTGPKGILIGIAAAIAVVIGLLYWFVPHATVTILTTPKALTASETVTIDPTLTAVDGQKHSIPGIKQEKSVSGKKTIAVSGKKDVGDPAKGAVTIYNKTTSEKTFDKGSVLTSGSLKFTLDADVKVASASESVGSITFGKADGAITASQIGPDSNLPSGTEFHFEDYNSDVAVARNDAALTGGTSKSVTVVSRADQDALIKAISADLVDQAKKDLAGTVTGAEKLIDQTIETSVTQKTFDQELDQEAKQLSGNATVTVTGTSYSEDDIKTLMKAMITGEIPQGYALAEGRTQVTLANVKVSKTGVITAKATITADAMPTIDTESIRSQLVGKTISAVEEYLKGKTGVAGVVVKFGLTFSHSRLPVNASNITVDVAIQ